MIFKEKEGKKNLNFKYLKDRACFGLGASFFKRRLTQEKRKEKIRVRKRFIIDLSEKPIKIQQILSFFMRRPAYFSNVLRAFFLFFFF